MCSNINTDSNSELLFFCDFMDIFQNFNNLRHNNNFLNYFFKNVWDLDKLFFLNKNLNWSLLESINNLQYFLNVVNIPNNLFEFFDNDCFFNDRLNFLYSFIFISYFNNFFIFSNYLFDLLNDNWNFNYFFNNVLNISVHIDDLRNDSLNLYYFWNLNNLFLKSFHLIYFWNSSCSFNHFFNNLLSCNNLLDNSLNRYYFLDYLFYLFDFLGNIWDFFNNFLVLNVVYNLFFYSSNFIDMNNLLFNCDYFLHNLRYLNRFFNNFSNRNDFLNYFFCWNRNLNWHNDLSLNFDNLRRLNCQMHDLFNLNVARNFFDNFNNLFNNNLIIDNLLFVFRNFH